MVDNHPGHDIVVVGASMGGIEALGQLVAGLPADLPAAVFLVQHMAAGSPGMLARLFARNAVLPVEPAVDGQPIRKGRVYVAVPDRHLLLIDGHVRLVHGPRENRARPAIDLLFRSAAVAYASRVVGVVLTGFLDDGTAGLHAIKRCGGLAVVQAPFDAAYPDMPRSALQNVAVDHSVPLSEIPVLLARLAVEPAPPAPPVPDDIRVELGLLTSTVGTEEMAQADAVKTSLVCPECGGTIYEVQGDAIQRFRCHVGHAYTAATLLDDQSDSLERALWAAVRTLEDRATLLDKMAGDSDRRGISTIGDDYRAKAQEARRHSDEIHRLLMSQAERSVVVAETPEQAPARPR